MTSRSSAVDAEYQEYLKTVGDKCVFCHLTNPVVEQTSYFYVIKNIFAYDTWDGVPVTRHLMIVPKAHRLELATFDDREAREFLALLTKYEQRGFSVYARSKHNSRRSIAHQHTHLIKLAL